MHMHSLFPVRLGQMIYVPRVHLGLEDIQVLSSQSRQSSLNT